MTNETPIEETPSTLTNLKDKVRQLPWKKIAIAAAVTTVAVIVVKNRDALSEPTSFVVTSAETLDDGSVLVTADPITD